MLLSSIFYPLPGTCKLLCNIRVRQSQNQNRKSLFS
nr:MAG TPA: hypothetical protein [Bacteriophage sp.]